mgnify:CR=1 FL=1|jgi:hypothetical protein
MLMLGWRLAAASVPTPSPPSPPACSLNGALSSGDGKTCVCDSAWRGAACDVLDVRPADPARAGYRNATGFNSWGGNALFDSRSGRWHLFSAQFVDRKTLDAWGTASEIVRAVSDTPFGPFVYAETVVPVWAHNPTVRKFQGKFYLYMIGAGHNADDGGKPSNLNFTSAIHVSVADDITGPWSVPEPVLFEDASPSLWVGRYNPSPHFLDDGSVLLAFNGGPRNSSWPKSVAKEYPGIALSAPGPRNYRGPFKLIHHGLPVFPKKLGCFGGTGEDPFIWHDKRGLKMLIHGMCPTGLMQAHFASSPDLGATWYLSPRETYTYNVGWVNGSSTFFSRVERPQLSFDPATGHPIALWNGVCEDFGCLGILGGRAGRSYTLARPLARAT